MTLRTTAVIAGALGLLMAIAGLLAQTFKADHQVVATTEPAAAIVVVGPDVLALPGIERIAVSGEGGVQAHSLRPVDAAAWLANREAVYVTGYATWEELTTSTTPVAVPSGATQSPSESVSASAPSAASASPSAAASPSPSASPSTTASASASAVPSASPEATAGEEPPAAEPTAAEIAALYGAGDLWREDWRGTGRVAVTGAMLAPGETLVFFSEDGSPLTTVEFFTERPVNDEWIAPLMVMGALLALLGLVALLSAVIDLRPLQARIESWRTGRQAEQAEPAPGSRRQRRLAGPATPEVDLADAPATEVLPGGAGAVAEPEAGTDAAAGSLEELKPSRRTKAKGGDA